MPTNSAQLRVVAKDAAPAAPVALTAPRVGRRPRIAQPPRHRRARAGAASRAGRAWAQAGIHHRPGTFCPPPTIVQKLRHFGPIHPHDYIVPI